MWKMNIEVIKSDLFRCTFKSWWNFWKTKKSQYHDLGEWWDIGKRKIKDLCTQTSKFASHERNNRIRNLEREIKELENDCNISKMQDEQLKHMRYELRKIFESKAEGSKIRSRVKWFEDGERPTRYFYGLEKRNAKEKCWERILNAEGGYSYGTRNVIKTQLDFYTQLYKSESVDQGEATKFINSLEAHLSNDSVQSLESDIELIEMTHALKKMKNNKSPGPDGIAVEFYKLFWKDIGEDLLQVFKHSYATGKLPYSQNLALLRLIFKKGQREDIKSWRPISLLNTDIKILSKLSAQRLKQVLPSIIHTDQKGCVQGHFIGEIIHLIEDILET